LPALQRGDVVTTTFPYSDDTGSKRRPVCVLSVEGFNATGDAVVAMITSNRLRLERPAFGDVLLEDWAEEGLLVPSVLRAGRLWERTLDLLSEPRGRLTTRDLKAVEVAMRTVLGL
jgi:mRNA-degrading endonuclease toxin of MazEF toxin-antitoxin module